MSKLHEVLAVEGDLDSAWKKVQREAEITFSKKSEHFRGMYQRYEAIDDDPTNTEPDKFSNLDTTVIAKLEYIFKHMIKYVDVVAQKDATNQVAKANIEIDGKVLVSDVPATTLLGLESKLSQLKSLLNVIPTLAPGIEWVDDKQAGKNIWKRKDALVKNKTKKTFQHKILVQADEHHPAQVEKWPIDQVCGKYIESQSSGEMSSAQKSSILDRVDRLHRAVKQARQRANATTVVNINIGKALTGFIMDE